MVYESSYESGRTPFVPDTKRGYWAQPSDFIYACLGLAFKMDIFSMAWFFFFEMGIFAILPYMICMALYVVPLFVIQSFLGQFSSSGFVSALRISPLFKGMGYISIGLNLSVLTYIGIYGAIPLFYLVHSFRPTLPWSCEAFLKWSADAPMAHDLTLCNSTFDFEMKLNEPIEKWLNDVSSPNATTTTPSSIEETTMYDEMRDIYEYRLFQIPSIMFFRSLFADYQFLYPDRPGKLHFYISWELVLSMIAVWSIVALIFWKASTVEKMGKLIRYTVWLILSLLTICLIRFIFLPGAREALHTYFIPRLQDIGVGMAITPFFAASSFGAGWGAIISLSSYNKFNTNIMRYGWYICAGQMMIMVTFGFLSFLIEKHFVEITGNTFMDFMESHWIMFLSSGSALANMEVPNLWCILFYTVLTLSALLVMVLQMITIQTAIFDDFEFLRSRKQELTFGIIGFLALCSIYFCSNVMFSLEEIYIVGVGVCDFTHNVPYKDFHSNLTLFCTTQHGLTFFPALTADGFFAQTLLNLLLLLVVLWIYGRVRFQRDIEFMLGQRFSTWRINILRFVAPLGMLLTLLICATMAYFQHYLSTVIMIIIAVIFIGIPWIFVPGYAAFRLVETTGTFLARWKRCCHPTDWYPVEAEDRQRYEEAMGNMDITHQLKEIREEEA